jgi:formylglycine-generating enzyme required for sulfatase activity
MRTEPIMAAALAGLLVAACNPGEGGSAANATATFSDCETCPEMVRLPAGEFMMGSPTSEMYRGAEAQHRVTLRPFALGKYEVTFDQWDACVADGGCDGYRPEDNGWGRGNNPVISVSWNDATAYAQWLSRKTGKPYRLPSEAEWEYAARAGTTTAFAFGETLTTDKANFDGSPNGENRARTTAVGSFPPNAFGLHDMHGNVWEWIADCWSDEYTAETPANGAAYERPNCQGHVMRGGSWEDYSGEGRAAARVGAFNDDAFPSDGFRVALSLE